MWRPKWSDTAKGIGHAYSNTGVDDLFIVAQHTAKPLPVSVFLQWNSLLCRCTFHCIMVQQYTETYVCIRSLIYRFPWRFRFHSVWLSADLCRNINVVIFVQLTFFFLVDTDLIVCRLQQINNTQYESAGISVISLKTLTLLCHRGNIHCNYSICIRSFNFFLWRSRCCYISLQFYIPQHISVSIQLTLLFEVASVTASQYSKMRIYSFC